MKTEGAESTGDVAPVWVPVLEPARVPLAGAISRTIFGTMRGTRRSLGTTPPMPARWRTEECGVRFPTPLPQRLKMGRGSGVGNLTEFRVQDEGHGRERVQSKGEIEWSALSKRETDISVECCQR